MLKWPNVLNLHQDLKKKEALSLYEQALSRAGLTDTKRILSSRPYQLSGGMLQRCLIALAIAGNAKLVVADEPTTALDAIHRDKAVEQFLHLQEQGCALLLVTHDFDVARACRWPCTDFERRTDGRTRLRPRGLTESNS